MTGSVCDAESGDAIQGVEAVLAMDGEEASRCVSDQRGYLSFGKDQMKWSFASFE